MTVKTSISLTDDIANYVRREVSEGRARSASAVVQAALERQMRDEQAALEERAVMRAFFADRLGGPTVSLGDMQEGIDDLMRQEFGDDGSLPGRRAG